MQQIIVNIDETGSKEQDDLIAMVHHLSHGQGSGLGNEKGVESPTEKTYPIVRSLTIWFVTVQMNSRSTSTFPEFSGA
jgi:hypothetical protein